MKAAVLVGVVAITAIVTFCISRDSDRTAIKILIPTPSPITFQVSGEVLRLGVYSHDCEPQINDAVGT